MNFDVGDDRLSVTFRLDTEPAELDLRDGGLGEEILAAAVNGMIRSSWVERSPEGEAWADLRPRTAGRKPGLTSQRIGILTGDMLDPSRFEDGGTVIEERSATWYYKHDGENSLSYKKMHSFHNGNERNRQVPRRVIGWTDTAKETAARLIDAAIFELQQ